MTAAPLHHYEMKERESNSFLGDERHIIFINGENKDEGTALGRFVHDFKCNSADNMYYDILANRVRYFKEKGDMHQMSSVLEEMKNEVARRVKEEVTKEVTREITKKVSRKTAILTTIENFREFGINDEAIEEKIINKFNISPEAAREYMLGKIA
ncbi:MAG: hypothetical protein LUD81_08455 [Clostridiales bacterium]|nr:hypothetical protein [Clostridiales bacterium]